MNENGFFIGEVDHSLTHTHSKTTKMESRATLRQTKNAHVIYLYAFPKCKVLWMCTADWIYSPFIWLCGGIFSHFAHHSSLFDDQNHNHPNSMPRIHLFLSLGMFMPHLWNGQIILVLFTSASHITLCLRFRDVLFFIDMCHFFSCSLNMMERMGVWL